MVTGWYDIFLPGQLRDYDTLVKSGNPPRLTVGPWSHVSNQLFVASTTEAYDFLREHFIREPIVSGREHPVRIFVTGVDQWREYDTWPPGSVDQDWWLHAEGGLSSQAPSPSAPSAYVYDPADPTPSRGGPGLASNCGPVDNSVHERRADVLTFTSDALRAPLEVLGEPTAAIWLRSDRRQTDLFVRLCDVHPDGRSMTVCDGIRRIGGSGPVDIDPRPDAEGARLVRVALWPTAHHFAAGHCVRVQVSSGAHPRYARNPGGDEPLATARTLHRAHQEILHDPRHPSAVALPTMTSGRIS